MSPRPRLLAHCPAMAVCCASAQTHSTESGHCKPCSTECGSSVHRQPSLRYVCAPPCSRHPVDLHSSYFTAETSTHSPHTHCVEHVREYSQLHVLVERGVCFEVWQRVHCEVWHQNGRHVNPENSANVRHATSLALPRPQVRAHLRAATASVPRPKSRRYPAPRSKPPGCWCRPSPSRPATDAAVRPGLSACCTIVAPALRSMIPALKLHMK